MNETEQLLQNAREIEEKLGYRFKDRNLLSLAFIHRSYVNENRDVHAHNERLEFLGDSVLGLLIADHLYQHLPDTSEGELSYLRSRLVEASSCMQYVQKLQVEKYVLLGKGERMNDGRGRDSILADLFEGIIGAIFLDGGIDAASDFLFKNFKTEIEEILKTPLSNWKALLQDYCQKKYHTPPTYEILQQSGPDHSKTFTIAVIVNEEQLGIGTGSSKKEAQQGAAENALSRLPSSDGL